MCILNRSSLFIVTAAVIGYCSFVACKKEGGNEYCAPHPLDPYSLGPLPARILFYYACFNPNSDDEILYVQNDSAGTFLYTLNLTTRQKKLVVKTDIYSVPQWSSNGWIAFTSVGFALWKVKPNGDSLTMVSSPGLKVYRPSWNYDNSGFIANAYLGKTIRVSGNGNLINTLIVPKGSYAEYIDANHFLTNGSLLGVYNILNSTFDPIAPVDFITCLGAAPLNDHEVLWSDVNGIFKADRLSKIVTKLKEPCESASYWYPSLNRSKSKVLWIKVETKIDETISSERGVMSYKVVLTSPDGSDEESVAF